MSWSMIEIISAHVMPCEDTVEHVAEDDCICGPTAVPVELEDGSIRFIMRHHSLDGREASE